MDTGTAGPTLSWQAGFATRRVYPRRLKTTTDGETKVVSIPLELLYVVLQRGEGEQIVFAVSWPPSHGRLVFTDTRECHTGTAGSTGRWGTRPPSKPGGKRRTLTPSAWKQEVRRFIGEERAEEIVRCLMRSRSFF